MSRVYPALLPLFCVLVAITLADQFHPPALPLIIAAALCVATGFLPFGRKRAAIFYSCALGLCVAAHFALQMYDHGPHQVASFADRQARYELWGRVSDWPVLKADHTELSVAVDSLFDGRAMVRVNGGILLTIREQTTAFARGDRLAFQARLYPIAGRGTPGGFDFARYSNLRGLHVSAYLSGASEIVAVKRPPWGALPLVDGIRDQIRTSLTSNLSPPHAALALGFLLGETRGIPTDVYEYFRNSGTLHLLAVSGSNVAYVISFVLLLLLPFSLTLQRRSAILIGVVVLYAFLAYGEPSVIRASLMAILLLMATILERRVDLTHVLMVTALAVLLVWPTQLFDAGAQMSFLITGGLVITVPRIMQLFWRHRERHWFRFALLPLAGTVVAQIYSIPIVVYYFERITWGGFLSNPVVVPLVTVGVFGIAFLLVSSFIFPPFGLIVGSVIDSYFNAVVATLELFGRDLSLTLPLGAPPSWVVVVSYILLGLMSWGISLKQARRHAAFGTVLLVASLLTADLVRIHTAPAREGLVTTLPGGVVTLIRDRSGNGDLIIQGMRDREYDIGERIIKPLLDRERIRKVRNLFILDAEYGALSDLFSLSDRLDVEMVFLAAALLPAAQDATAQFQHPVTWQMIPEGVDSPQSSPGYGNTHEGCLVLQSERARIYFPREIADLPEDLPEDSIMTCLVLSRGYQVEPARRLLSAQPNCLIICAETEQKTGADVLPIGEQMLINLGRVGWHRFVLEQ